MRRVARIVAAHFGVVVGKRLREINRAGFRLPTQRLVFSIEGTHGFLCLIRKEKHRAFPVFLFQAIAREHRALPHVFEKLLGDDAVLVPGGGRHRKQNDNSMKGQLRRHSGLTAEGAVKPAVVESVERGGDGDDDIAARFVGNTGPFLSPEINQVLECSARQPHPWMIGGSVHRPVHERAFLPFGARGVFPRRWCRGDKSDDIRDGE